MDVDADVDAVRTLGLQLQPEMEMELNLKLEHADSSRHWSHSLDTEEDQGESWGKGHGGDAGAANTSLMTIMWAEVGGHQQKTPENETRTASNKDRVGSPETLDYRPKRTKTEPQIQIQMPIGGSLHLAVNYGQPLW
ncbi:GM19978 [Drosophila sechellia]|uniref:GM19978 n=1 Tax=Drosophila sechellia TaxID=7238 RepID=B4HMU7_DROSE|nr:GM19978 [Drosophila sechellia]